VSSPLDAATLCSGNPIEAARRNTCRDPVDVFARIASRDIASSGC
jgi:hypothetical protein